MSPRTTHLRGSRDLIHGYWDTIVFFVSLRQQIVIHPAIVMDHQMLVRLWFINPCPNQKVDRSSSFPQETCPILYAGGILKWICPELVTTWIGFMNENCRTTISDVLNAHNYCQGCVTNSPEISKVSKLTLHTGKGNRLEVVDDLAGLSQWRGLLADIEWGLDDNIVIGGAVGNWKGE